MVTTTNISDAIVPPQTEISFDIPDEGEVNITTLNSEILQLAVGVFSINPKEAVVMLAQKFGHGGLFSAFNVDEALAFAESIRASAEEARSLTESINEGHDLESLGFERKGD